ncbi:MAG: hypothetical protein HWE23_17025 [Rhodobacteraceae bacterium]|nr:hypothetical protein [Paracoccaceae bacterium]
MANQYTRQRASTPIGAPAHPQIQIIGRPRDPEQRELPFGLGSWRRVTLLLLALLFLFLAGLNVVQAPSQSQKVAQTDILPVQ